MPKDQVLLLESRSQQIIEARIVLADATTAQIRFWIYPQSAGGRIYQNQGRSISALQADLAEIVPAEGGILRPDHTLDPDWAARLPDALRAALAVPVAEPAPEEKVRIRTNRDGLRRIGVLQRMFDLEDAPVTEILLRPNGTLAAREWESQRRIPSTEPGVMALRDSWTPFIETRLPDREIREIRAARGPDRGVLLENAYWEHLNARMEDPLLLPEDDWLMGRPLTVKGGQDLLDELLTLAAWADPETAERLPGTLTVIAARPDLPDSTARISDEDSNVHIGSVLADYAKVILAVLSPEGTSISYNGGAVRRRSGYDTCEILHEIEIPIASAHERLDAARRLAEWRACHAPELR